VAHFRVRHGAANPTLSYASTGLLNGDALSGGLATTATTTSNVGAYGITPGTLANSNYSITYMGANLTVTAAASPVPVAPLAITESAQLVLFPSYFTADDLLSNGASDSSVAATNFAADPDISTCTPTGVSRSLNRRGRVGLTGENAASCGRLLTNEVIQRGRYP
jgi:MBG domain (YGX type)